MTAVTEYLTEAAHYIDEVSRGIVEALTDEQFAILVAATDELNSGCDQPGIDNGLVKTHETFVDFDASRANHWTQRGYREELSLAAPAVKFEDVQMLKGQPRLSFIVLDMGDYRVVLK
jgi:hypothetical protein